MKRIALIAVLVLVMVVPVNAVEITAPTVPPEGEALLPDVPDSFGEGLLQILREVIPYIQPSLVEAAQVCLSLMAVVLLVSLVRTFPGAPAAVTELSGAVAIGALLLRSSNSMISLGVETVNRLSEYGKLLLPVMTAALAAQGGAASSAALYTGTVLFDSVLSTVLSVLMVPMIYIFLTLSAANSAIGEDMLKKLRDFVKWIMTWTLKTVLYCFTGYMGITGVISGSADAAALKAAKLTISGMVPVVGNILSDASEAVLVGAGIVKSAAGVYGLLAVIALWIRPFIQIGIQYLMLKITAAVCEIFGTKQMTGLIQDFSAAMGILLAMTGTECLLLLISTVCFMKGVG